MLFSVSTMIFIVLVLSPVSGASVSTSACFPASIDGCVVSERFHLRNRCHQVGKTVPTGFVSIRPFYGGLVRDLITC